MTPNQQKGAAVLALLVVGAGLGRASVDPVVVRDVEVVDKVIEPAPVEVEVDRPYVPSACTEAFDLSQQFARQAHVMVDFVPTLLDAIGEVRKALTTGIVADATAADNTLRNTDDEITTRFLRVEELRPVLDAAIEECEEQTQ